MKIKQIECLLYKEKKGGKNDYLNQKAEVPLIFCSDQMFNLVSQLKESNTKVNTQKNYPLPKSSTLMNYTKNIQNKKNMIRVNESPHRK